MSEFKLSREEALRLRDCFCGMMVEVAELAIRMSYLAGATGVLRARLNYLKQKEENDIRRKQREWATADLISLDLNLQDFKNAAERAKKVLRKGDEVLWIKCGQESRFIFDSWVGDWMGTKSRRAWFAPPYVTAVNGKAVNFNQEDDA